jgi:cell division protein FtsL
MNSAAKIITNRQVGVRSYWFSLALSPYQWAINGLIFSILLSSLFVVIVTNEARINFQNLEQAHSQQDQLKTQYGQLVLEKSTLLTQARIEKLAQNQLQMSLPKAKKMVVLK